MEITASETYKREADKKIATSVEILLRHELQKTRNHTQIRTLGSHEW